MLSFLKVFARGIICTVLLPVILLVWVLYGVYCLIAFMVVFVKNIILFFAGENPAGDMKEDIEAKKILPGFRQIIIPKLLWTCIEVEILQMFRCNAIDASVLLERKIVAKANGCVI